MPQILQHQLRVDCCSQTYPQKMGIDNSHAANRCRAWNREPKTTTIFGVLLPVCVVRMNIGQLRRRICEKKESQSEKGIAEEKCVGGARTYRE
jgi:hypothetical protein